MPNCQMAGGFLLALVRGLISCLAGEIDPVQQAWSKQRAKTGAPLLNEIQPATCRSRGVGCQGGRVGEGTVAVTAAEGRLTACWSYEMPSRLVIECRLGSLSLFSSSIIPGLLGLGKEEFSPASECNLLTSSVLACCWSTHSPVGQGLPQYCQLEVARMLRRKKDMIMNGWDEIDGFLAMGLSVCTFLAPVCESVCVNSVAVVSCASLVQAWI